MPRGQLNVRPRDGLTVLHPDGRPIRTGKVPNTTFYRRLIKDGDLIKLTTANIDKQEG